MHSQVCGQSRQPYGGSPRRTLSIQSTPRPLSPLSPHKRKLNDRCSRYLMIATRVRADYGGPVTFFDKVRDPTLRDWTASVGNVADVHWSLVFVVRPALDGRNDIHLMCLQQCLSASLSAFLRTHSSRDTECHCIRWNV